MEINWEKDSVNFIDYDTNLLITHKVLQGKPISPLSYSTLDTYGNNQYQNLQEVPFAHYNMFTHTWENSANFTQRFPIDTLLLFEEIESTGTTIQGPSFDEGTIITTGIVELDSVYENRSDSQVFELVDPSEYNWYINGNGDLVVSGLPYSTGDVFKIAYYAYHPIRLPYSLAKPESQLHSLKVLNSTGYEYVFSSGIDYSISQDGYAIYFTDLYNSILSSGNFSLYDTFDISYQAPYTQQVDLSQNLLLLLQDSEGNDIPIDTIPIDSMGLFSYEELLREDSPLSLPLGGGKRIVNLVLAYLPLSVYNTSSDQLEGLNYYDAEIGYICPYIPSNSWALPITVETIPDKVKLTMIEDITQNMVINQKHYEMRTYHFNNNPSEALEQGEEYTKVMIDALCNEEYEFGFKLVNSENKPINNSVIWLHVGLMPKSETKFLNERIILSETNISTYYEALGTHPITSIGPGDGANKMFGRPLYYELGSYNVNASGYGPYIWLYGITNEFGEVKFQVSFDEDYLTDFSDIFGSMEGFTSIEDIVMYVRAFSSYFEWDDFAMDSPDQYLCSEEDNVFNLFSSVPEHDMTQLALQDATYVEGLLRLHKRDIALGMNDYYTYTLPDEDLGGNYEPLRMYLYATEADLVPTGTPPSLDSLTEIHNSYELEAQPYSIFEDNHTYYALIQFYTPSGSVAESLALPIQEEGWSGVIEIDNQTVFDILQELGPGISSIKVQIAESEYYKASPVVSLPLEIRPANWIKFGEKNTKIDLLDPFINAWGSGYEGEEEMVFESNYPHLIGTFWVEPDFTGTGDEVERSINDYIGVDLLCSVQNDDGSLTNFPLRHGVMLRPGNRDGFMYMDIGLGPEDAFLQNLTCFLNLSFNIHFNQEQIYNESRDVDIYLLDLRLQIIS